MESTTKGESVLDVLARMKGELSFDVDEFVDADANGKTAPTSQPQPPTGNSAEGLPGKKVASTLADATAGNSNQATLPLSHDNNPTRCLEETSDYLSGLLGRYDAPSAESPEQNERSAALPRKKIRPLPTPVAVAAPESQSVDASLADETPPTDLLEPGLASSDNSSNDPNVGVLDQQDFVPRKRVPEEKACIDAMRELAVHSARKAIQVCDNKRRGFDAKHRLGLATTAFVISAGAFFFANHVFSFLGIVALLGIVTGCLFVVNWQKTMALVKKSS
jgi:hypothetical protein